MLPRDCFGAAEAAALAMTILIVFFVVLWGFWPISVYVTERFLPSPHDGTLRRAARP